MLLEVCLNPAYSYLTDTWSKSFSEHLLPLSKVLDNLQTSLYSTALKARYLARLYD